MKEVKFTEQGPVFVETLQVSSEKFEMPDFDNILVSYKDTLIFALQKRANHCIKDLNDNSERIISTNTNSIEYYRTDKTCNSFNNNNYVAIGEYEGYAIDSLFGINNVNTYINLKRK